MPSLKRLNVSPERNEYSKKDPNTGPGEFRMGVNPLCPHKVNAIAKKVIFFSSHPTNKIIYSSPTLISSLSMNACIGRRWRSCRPFGGAADWEYEIGDPAALVSGIQLEMCTNPFPPRDMQPWPLSHFLAVQLFESICKSEGGSGRNSSVAFLMTVTEGCASVASWTFQVLLLQQLER